MSLNVDVPNHDIETRVSEDCTSLYQFYLFLCKGPIKFNRNLTAVILLPAHPASFAHKFLFQRVPASPGMQKYCRLVIENSV